MAIGSNELVNPDVKIEVPIEVEYRGRIYEFKARIKPGASLYFELRKTPTTGKLRLLVSVVTPREDQGEAEQDQEGHEGQGQQQTQTEQDPERNARWLNL